MTKTITLPDGSTQVLEGTPEEIAKLENLLKKESVKEGPKKGKKGILLGKEEVQQMIDQALAADRLTRPIIPWWFWYTSFCPRQHTDEWTNPWTNPWKITWTAPQVGDPINPLGGNTCGGYVSTTQTGVKLDPPPAGTIIYGIPGCTTVSNGDGTYRAPTDAELQAGNKLSVSVINNPGFGQCELTTEQISDLLKGGTNVNSPYMSILQGAPLAVN
ncbi:MAG: hypothetical protein ACYDHY_06690 [Acidiferrobacterales bacterium]